MYEASNPKTKKALKALMADGKAEFIQPGGEFDAVIPEDGDIFVEGPHFPQPHRWYARVTFVGGWPTEVDGKKVDVVGGKTPNPLGGLR